MKPQALAVILVVAGSGLMLAGSRLHWRPSLPVSLAVCILLQFVMILIAANETPADVSQVFQWVGLTVRDGQDPVTTLPPGFWNFLPLAAWMHAGATSLPLPWTLAGKLGPLLATLVLVWLVGLLCDPEVARLRQWQWAVNPVGLLVVGWHGQIDSLAMMFGGAALVAAQRHRLTLAGVFLGLGIATKTWPVVYAVGLLLDRASWTRTARFWGGPCRSCCWLG